MQRLFNTALAVLLVGATSFSGVSSAQTPGPKSVAKHRVASVTSTMKTYDPGKWVYWGGDAGQTRYAPLDQINAGNVSRLKIAWRWSADDKGGPATNNYKATPLLDDGVLYVPWVNHGAAAIDAQTGKTLWTFEPPQLPNARGGSLAPRSLAFWTDGKEKRLFHNSLDGRLIAIDAKTGKMVPGFGTNNGWVDLHIGLTEGRANQDISAVSPALVVGDVIVVQSLPAGTRNKESTPGDYRGFDVRTGKKLWQFHVVPQPGEFGNDTWKDGSWKYVGEAGTWTMMSADLDTGYVYIAGETPSNDFYGGERKGNGLFAESIVCIDTKTGKRVWHFQTVHHGLFDYDNPAAPILHDIVKDGKRIKVVSQITKQGFIFTFDRLTGAPIWPIEERPVPQSTVPGEETSPTQPFPTHPAPFMPQGYSEDRLIDFTPKLHAEAVEIMKSYTKGPLFTPPSVVTPTNKGSFVFPGFGGGANWNGAAVDPASNIMYLPIRYRPSAVGVTKGDPARTNLAYIQANNTTVEGPEGLPLLKPPYSEVIAIDMNKGDYLWRVPNGGAPDVVRNSPVLKGLNLDFDHMGEVDIRPGPLLTKTLLFLGESGTISGARGGPAFRAYDKKTGKVLAEVDLPTMATGAPMTYMLGGVQYIVVAVADQGKPTELVALTLDGKSGNGAPPPGGVQPAAAPKPEYALSGNARLYGSPAGAFAGNAPPPRPAADTALGQQAYARVCSGCHGVNAEGQVGPPIAGRMDVDNITRVINQGQGEMPSMAAGLTPAEVNAVAAYLGTLGGAGAGPSAARTKAGG
jgi:glucose dehydrogenase